MNNQSYSSNHIEQYLRLWVYLLPVVGVIPAVWTLYRSQNKNFKTKDGQHQDCPALRQQLKASRLSINLMILWLSSYALFSLGAANVSELMSFRLLYVNAITTTGYFLICTVLLWQLGKKNLCDSEDLN
ncbi:MAG: hypothetical protein AAF298_23905 [Cyanobacteria bacterium P01_A01_bin.40]